ncbi:MAG: hypothetical protein EVA70_08785 [Parvularculaceae bacterium]|nr:MAG: hypothetical protein EVA70_08785 [Parvularculaceae bacterium]
MIDSDNTSGKPCVAPSAGGEKTGGSAPVKKKSSSIEDGQQTRESRLAEALRANLRRRKAKK